MEQDGANYFMHLGEERLGDVLAETLRYLWDPRLDPLFWALTRTGVVSAWFEHIPFAHWLVQVVSPRILVELGTQGGVSYSAFCESVLRLNLPTQCFAVDTWKGDDHTGYYGEDVFLDFERFHSARYASFSEFLRCTFDEALIQFAEDSIDLLHVDGYHTYEAVRNDFENWCCKLSERAVVLFHDTNTRERDFGVWKYFAELKTEYPSFEFTHGHGLGVLAVGEQVPTEVVALCKLDDPRKVSAVRNRFARIGERWSTFWRAEQAERDVSERQARLVGLEQIHSDLEQRLSSARSRIGELDETQRQSQKREADATRQIAEHRAQLAEMEKVRLEHRAQLAEMEKVRLEHRAQLAEMEKVRLELEQRLHQAHSRISDLDEIERRSQQREAEAARQIAELKQNTAHLKSAAAERESAIVQQLLDKVHEQLAVFEKEAEQFRSEYIKAVNSRSWRITSPLRRVNFYLKEGRRRIARFVERRRAKANGPLLQASSFFQADWYLREYPDVQAAGIDPAVHYVVDGWREGRDPSPLFSTSWYLEQYPDVRQADINPLVHFIQNGLTEGRMPCQAVSTAPWLKSCKPEVLAYLAGLPQQISVFPSTTAGAPEISIIILNLNKAYLTMQCLITLWMHTAEARYEIIVVDNGSTASEQEILRALKGPFRIVQLSSNRYYGEANNIGAEAACGDLLLFMNNDVVVTPGWLAPLVRALREKPDCGAAGPKFVFPDGRLQEAGGYVKENGVAVQRGNGQDPDDPSFMEECMVDYVSAATLAISKENFIRVGGFDFCWEPAYYEDVDLCFKLCSLNLKTYYVSQSSVIHYQGATSSETSHNLQLQNIVEINRAKFLERWGPYLTNRNNTSMPKVLLGSSVTNHHDRTDNRPRAGLFTPYNIIPGGGERYLLTIAEALSGTHSITLITPERVSSFRIANVAKELGLQLSDIHVATLQEVQKDSFSLWIAMGNAIVPPAKAQGKLSILVLQFPFPLTSQSIEQGRQWWTEYDLVVTYSRYARDHVIECARRYQFSPQKVEIIFPPVTVNARGSRAVRRSGSILSVGRFFTGGHCKNQHVMIEAFRRMVEETGNSELELHLAGSLHPEAEHRQFFQHCRALASDLPVFFHLDAPSQELQALFDNSSIYWHATGLCSDLTSHPERAEHFGISVVEAMAAGCIPVVCGCGGPVEIIEDGVSGLIYSDVDQLVALTKEVLGEWTPFQFDRMRDAAKARASLYNVERFKSAWLNTASRRAYHNGAGCGRVRQGTADR
jgi:GT2 family glycosyltransferase/glycosyltransferase involved in cell wall biosynthesis